MILTRSRSCIANSGSRASMGTNSLNVHENKGAEEEDGDEISPDCYVLDLGMALGCSKSWIRKDYIRLY